MLTDCSEDCKIEPKEVQMQVPSAMIKNESASTQTSADSATAPPTTTTRMIDWALGLTLSTSDERILNKAFKMMPPYSQSLNQTLSWASDVPLFVDIELKKTHSQRDPRVQLAIWAAAGFSKRHFHGWDETVAMPGITVSGHEWEYYLFFKREDEIVSQFWFPLNRVLN